MVDICSCSHLKKRKFFIWFSFSSAFLIIRKIGMCSIRYFLILYFIQWSTCSNVKLVKERLTKDGEHLSIKRLLEIPSPHYFLNRFYFADYPVKINLTNEITKKIREWSPELLMLDATSPYYFSPDDRANLLAYLEAG